MFDDSRNNIEKHRIWASTRSIIEALDFKRKRGGKKSKSYWTYFEGLLNLFSFFLKVFGLYKRGLENAKRIVLKEYELEFDNLPPKFDGYKIMHLSDLHLDTIDCTEDRIVDIVKNIECDLCVMTGDYRKKTHGSFKNIVRPMIKITAAINSKDGILLILGNHDTYLMADYQYHAKHFKVLVNETVLIDRDEDEISITGTDDPFSYFTDPAIMSLENAHSPFKIALVHTSELYDIAAENHFSLYLCGHTHGGQICLPGGRPIITHQTEGRKFIKGFWKHNGMIGFTHQGCGVSGLPIRFYSESEIVVFTLKRKKK